GFQLQLDDELHLCGRRGAGVSERDDHPRDRVVRQHGKQQVESRSESEGRLRRSNRGRNGARVDERRVSHRRRVRAVADRAQGEEPVNAESTVTIMTTKTLLRLCLPLTLLASGALVSAQVLLPSVPPKQFGGSVTAAFEGWYDNPD